jgi:hypothetical protein
MRQDSRVSRERGDRLSEFIADHPFWSTVVFAAILLSLSATVLAYFPAISAFLGLGLQSPAIAEPAIGTQTLLVVVVTGAVALTGLLISVYQVRYRDQEWLITCGKNLNDLVNEAAKGIFDLANALGRLFLTVDAYVFEIRHSTESIRRTTGRQGSEGGTEDCVARETDKYSCECTPSFALVTEKFFYLALGDLVECLERIRKNPNCLRLAQAIARKMGGSGLFVISCGTQQSQ